MSAGIKSGVNWMRANSQPRTWAKVRTRSVFATPGTPSMSAWLPVKIAMSAFSMTSFWPMITLAVSCRAWVRISFRRSVFIFFEDLANFAVPLYRSAVALRSGVLGLEDGFSLRLFHWRDLSSLGTGLFPLAETNIQHVTFGNVAAQQIYEAGGGFLARDVILRLLALKRRNETHRVLPEEQAGQEHQTGGQPIQPVFAEQRRHPLGLDDAEMRLIKQHVFGWSDPP